MTKETWPAFYRRGESILWIDLSGGVVNGGWRPEFSADRLSCWAGADRDNAFTWAGEAPLAGDYNDVIGKFRESIGVAGYWVRRRRVRLPEDENIVTRVGSLAHYVAEDGGLVVSPREAHRFPNMYEATVALDDADTVEFLPDMTTGEPLPAF